jgi:hypothetical protein
MADNDQVNPEDDAAALEALIREHYEHEIEACEELADFSENALTPWGGRTIKKAAIDDPPVADEIFALGFARSAKTYKAAVRLAKQGFGEQAAMLNRSLFEGMAVGFWVHHNEEEASERFIQAYTYDLYQQARSVEQAGWLAIEDGPHGPEIAPEELAVMEKQFGKYGERPWTGHANVQKLVADIEGYWPENEHGLLWNFLRVVHRDNNQLLHATVSGLASAGNRMDSEGIYLSIGPSLARIEKGLFAAYWPFANHLDLLVKRFELPVQEDLDEMIGRQQYEFRRLTADEVKDVGRNDPCPCESGKKFKKCHEGRPLA